MIGLGHRFFQLQFGKLLTNEQLYLKFTNYLDGIGKGGALLLNQMEEVHDFFDSGVRSQRSNLRLIYYIVHVQLAIWLLLMFNKDVDQFYNIMGFLSVLIQYGVCWLAVFNERQDKFVILLQKWTNQLYQRMLVLDHIVPEIGRFDEIDGQLDEKKFARLWLRELSTSMNVPWHSIKIELLRSGDPLLPAVRIIVNGKQKNHQDPLLYGLTEKGKRQLPNQLFKTLRMFSVVNPVPFYGDLDEKKIMEKQVDRLRSHLIGLFGKRDQPPIDEYVEGVGWRSHLEIMDRTDLKRESLKRSMNTLGKILSSYAGLSITNDLKDIALENGSNE